MQLYYMYSITNLLHIVSVINYFSDMFWPQLLAILRELTNLLTCAAYVSNYVGNIPHVSDQI